MKTRMGNSLRRIVEHRWTQLFLGILLIATSLFEIGTFESDLGSAGIRSEHGILVYGFWMAIRAIVETIEGVERLAPE